MQIVIDIDKDDYERLKVYEKAPFCSLTSRVYEAIANGTPLPEHYGDLIDRNGLHYYCDYNNGLGCDKICHCDGCVHNVIQERTVNAAPVIIPATKGDNNANYN